MMPMTRGTIESLLDSPDERNFVVSAFADLTVKDGFRDLSDQEFRNQARSALAMMAGTEAVEALEANLAAVRGAIREVDPTAKGVAVFISQARGLHHVMPLKTQIENRLVIDEEPYVLPLLELWHGEPSYLVAVIDSDHAHIFEAHHGTIEEVQEVDRPDAAAADRRNDRRFSYKKRFTQAFHERLQNLDEDKYLQDVAGELARHWAEGEFQGLILLGQPQIFGAMRQLLPKDLAAAIVEEATQVMTSDPAQVADDVERVVERWHSTRDAEIAAELQQRWKEQHLVANGPTDVLDALQQGRATQVICGRGRDLAGAQCRDCGYRFGAPSETCHYCGGRCRTINAMQEILRMALKQRVSVHLFRRGPNPDPLDAVGGVSALLRAEANWAPDKPTAQATSGGA